MADIAEVAEVTLEDVQEEDAVRVKMNARMWQVLEYPLDLNVKTYGRAQSVELPRESKVVGLVNYPKRGLFLLAVAHEGTKERPNGREKRIFYVAQAGTLLPQKLVYIAATADGTLHVLERKMKNQG